MIKKRQKPIELDAHFRYRCPKCGYDKWISLAEASTKNFKIVCDCKYVFQCKRIKGIKIQYYTKKKTLNKSNNSKQPEPVQKSNEYIDTSISIDENVLNKSIKILIGYGFTKQESYNLLIKAYNILKINTSSKLVKKALELIGEQNESLSSS